MTSDTHTPGLVSVIIPAYNAAWCVRRAIESVLAQSHTPLEILLVDDGSTDDTASVVRSYGDRVRLLQKPNGGLSSARNHGIRHARGEWIAYLDADDWWLPEKLACQVALLQQRPEVGFCSCATRVEDPQGQALPPWNCAATNGSALEAIFKVNASVAGSGSAVMVRATVQRQAGFFDESLQSLEDIDMWMRLAAITDFTCLPQTLATILKHPDSMSRNLDKMRASAIAVMKKNRVLLPPALQGRFWRHAYAGMLADYAKWAFRAGLGAQATAQVLQGLAYAPLTRSRLLLGILLAGWRGQLKTTTSREAKHEPSRR